MATQIVVRGQHVAPSAYKITGLNPFTPSVATAQWDGSGASGDFFPCMSFYSQDGQLLARMGVEAAVTAGDSAQVTYGPFLRQAGGGDGIKYDTENTGDYLDVLATGTSPVFGTGFYFQADSDAIWYSVNGTAKVLGSAVAVEADNELDLGGSAITETIPKTGVLLLTDATLQTQVQLSPPNVTIKTDTNGTVLVTNHINGDLFRIDKDGALHGKTGQSLTFDL